MPRISDNQHLRVNKPPEEESKVVLYGTRQIVHAIASLSLKEIRANITSISSSIDNIYQKFKNKSIFLDANDISDLSHVKQKLKKASWFNKNARKTIKEIDDITAAFKGVQASTPLHTNAILGIKERIEQDLKSISVDAPDKDGDSPLVLAARCDNAEVAQILIKAGAKVNYQNPTGSTPLMSAAARGSTKALKILLNSGADVNISDRYGQSALFSALFNGQTDAAKILLEAGANPNLVDKEGRSILYLIKALRPKNWKALHQLFKKHISDAAVRYTKQHKQTKLVTHAFQLKGQSIISGVPIQYEGGQDKINASRMAKSIAAFGKSDSCPLPKEWAGELAETLTDALEANEEKTLQRIQEGKPALIFTGFIGHAVSVLIWEDICIICDRRRGLSSPLFVHRFDPKKLTVEAITFLQSLKGKTKGDHKIGIESTLPKMLGFKPQSQNELSLQRKVALPFQIVGNCSWASTEGIIKAYMLLKATKGAPDKVPSINSTFLSWQLFQQMLVLDKYLKHPIDPKLLFESFNSLWILKARCPKAFTPPLSKQLADLESKYLTTQSKKETARFRTNKALSSMFPHIKPLRMLQAILGTLSFIFTLQVNLKRTKPTERLSPGKGKTIH